MTSEQLPLVSVVTPSFQSGRFIGETIESVLNQDYPRIQYLVVDGGSTDDSVSILRSYGSRVTWVSEPDRGQAHAVNKGIHKATGEIVGWLNADDLYAPGAVSSAVEALTVHPNVGLVFSDCQFVDEESTPLGIAKTGATSLQDLVLDGCVILHQSAFFRRSALAAVGDVDESLHYVMDYDLLLRLLAMVSAHHVPGIWGMLRISPETKTSRAQELFGPEVLTVFDRLFADRPELRGIRDEAYRRTYLRSGLAYLRAGNFTEGLSYLRRAMEGGAYPFGGVAELADQIIASTQYQSYLRLTETEADAVMDEIASYIGQVDRNVASRLDIVRAFGAYQRNDGRRVVRLGTRALRTSSAAWRNRGLFSIIGSSLHRQLDLRHRR